MGNPVDIKFEHGTNVHVLRASDTARDLIAVGGDHTVDVRSISDTGHKLVASFFVGSRVTALAWSPKTTSPTEGDVWRIELAVATEDFALHLLTKSNEEKEDIYPFGGSLSGHHGRVNDMCYCGGSGEDGARYCATVSDDKLLMVWNLHPDVEQESEPMNEWDSPPPRPRPVALPFGFPRSLVAVDAHGGSARELLVADAFGNIVLADFRTDLDARAEESRWRGISVIELVEPRALADATAGIMSRLGASVRWRKNAPDAHLVGGVHGSKYNIWNLIRGSKPFVSGNTFPEGGRHFRWCRTHPEYFAISSAKTPAINIYHLDYLSAPPSVFQLPYKKALKVGDFDFMEGSGIPRIAAAAGRECIVFPIGTES